MLTPNLSALDARIERIAAKIREREAQAHAYLNRSEPGDNEDVDRLWRRFLNEDAPTIRAYLPEAFARIAARIEAVGGRLEAAKDPATQASLLKVIARQIRKEASAIAAHAERMGEFETLQDLDAELSEGLSMLAEALAELASRLEDQSDSLTASAESTGERGSPTGEHDAPVISAGLRATKSALRWWREAETTCRKSLHAEIS